jgi:hypothetical protein
MTATNEDQHDDPQEAARTALLKKIADQAGRASSASTIKVLAEAYAFAVAPGLVTARGPIENEETK